MKKLIILILSFLVVILESTLIQHLQIGGICPNLSLVFVMAIALTDGSGWGRMIGLFMGLAQDILFTPYIGPYALIYFTIGHIFGYVNRILPRGSLLLPMVFTLIADLAYGFLGYILYGFLAGSMNLMFYIRSVILPEAAYTSFWILPIYCLLNWLSTKLSAFKIKNMVTRNFPEEEDMEGTVSR